MSTLKKETHHLKIFYKAVFLLCCTSLFVLSTKAQQPDSTKVVQYKPVLFGLQDPEAILQSYSSVSGEQLLNRPVFHMASTFPGTLPGLYVNLSSGLPSSQSSYALRGTFPLVIVDGIPRSAVNLSPDQIESVAVIKDALGLSIMGMMGGNGVISITTKKGLNQKLKINFTSQLAINKQIYKPQFLESYDYANLFNEALRNDSRPPVYSQSELDKYKAGSNVYTNPNVDWYDYMLESSAPVQQYNLNFLGGGKLARYFLDLNYYNQEGFLKEDKSINTYSTSDNYKKYSIRTKIDIDLTSSTLFEVNVFGQMLKENSPGSPVDTILSNMATTPNNAYPVVNPDRSLGGNRIYLNNIYGQSVQAGYRTYNAADLNIDTRLTQKLTGILDGAYIGGLFSYNSIYRESLNRSKDRAIYGYSVNADGSDAYTQLTTSSPQKGESTYKKQNRMIYFELDMGYDFNIDKHSSQNKVLYSNNNYLVQNYLPFVNSGISGRSQYNYDKRYFAEIVWSYMGMNQFKPGERWGFFPAVGLGWNMAKEGWFKERTSVINLFKLRGTYGVSGDNLAASYFDVSSGKPSYYYDYMKYYSTSTSAYFSNTSASRSTLIENSLPYATTWSKIKKFNIGFDLTAFNNSFSFTTEFFNNNAEDVLQKRGTNNSVIIGAPLPLENLGQQRIRGFEFDVAYTKVVNDFQWSVQANTTIYKTKEVFMDEPNRAYDYMRRTGKPIGQLFGYKADGFFQTQEEINTYLAKTHIEGYTPVPGDLKYRDLNNDNIIDDRDVTEIGTTKPTIVYGLYGGVSWKGIGFNMQWAGIANRDVLLVDMPFQANSQQGYNQATKDHLNRWTPENRDADYPRLSVGGNTYNQSASSFWVKNGSYIRLKHIELSYDLPLRWISPVKLSKVRLFTAAYNLLTLTTLKDRDPELVEYTNVPNSQSFSVGVNIQF